MSTKKYNTCLNCLYAYLTKEDFPCSECHFTSKWEAYPPSQAAPSGTAEAAGHYQVGSKQPIEIMQEVMTPEEFRGYLRGNIIKYALRLGHKDEVSKEAQKIQQYSEWLVKALTGETIDPWETKESREKEN